MPLERPLDRQAVSVVLRPLRLIPKVATMACRFALLVTLALSVLAHASDNCESRVGSTFFADEGSPPLMFEEKRVDGFYFNQHIPPGQRFQVSALSKSDNGDDDYIIVTRDGRELHIRCPIFSAAVDATSSGQHVIQSDAEDFAEAKAELQAELQAKKDAAAVQVRRKRQAAIARQAEAEKERREYIAGRLDRGGVKIGMTEQRVLASSWGTPDKKNHTFTLSGETEQWVYADQFYLYFTNGILTSIQTDTPNTGYFQVAH